MIVAKREATRDKLDILGHPMKIVRQMDLSSLFFLKEKKHGSGDGAQELGQAGTVQGGSTGQCGQSAGPAAGQQKTVMVEVGGKKKRTGGTSKSKSLSSASLDLSR